MTDNKYYRVVTRGLLAAFIFALISALVLWHHNTVGYSKIRDLQQQLAHAKLPMQKDTIRDSIPVITQRVVEVDRTDYKQRLADKQLIKELGLKLADVVSENRMLREAHDTVRLQPKGDSLFSYHDRWVDFDVNIPQRLLDYAVRDSFVTDITRIRKHRFLWWRWGTKGYQVKHVNFNPHVDIRYNQTILIGD